MSRYWSADSDRDWQDSVGMYEEQDEFEEEPEMDDVAVTTVATKVEEALIVATKVEEALIDALAGWHYIRMRYGDLYGVGWDRVDTKLREAIEQLRAARVGTS